MKAPIQPDTLDPVRQDLDGLVVNTELTLISIIQGIALSFLSTSSVTAVTGLELTLWPYVLVGLLVILLFWSRSLIHILTVIRWPLEFGHNFFYIGCTLIEVILFTQIGNVSTWFLTGAAYSAAVWGLYAFDLRMIRRERDESTGPAGQRLFTLLAEEQQANVRFLMPAAVAFHLLAAAAIARWPQLFLQQNAHVWLGLLQLIIAVLYLGQSLRLFAQVSPLVIEQRRERVG